MFFTSVISEFWGICFPICLPTPESGETFGHCFYGKLAINMAFVVSPTSQSESSGERIKRGDSSVSAIIPSFSEVTPAGLWGEEGSAFV
jgi:hypothetical protein